ncbi:MAG: hypothetical protein Q9169_001996 [Polycauliona sp. 2 TL-2023]
MSQDSNDALQICVAYVLERLRIHDKSEQEAPLLVGVNGVQGIGKSYLVASLARELEEAAHDIRTLVLSIDDFYLTRNDQMQLAADHPDNPLVQHRGQPSTHDLSLALSIVASLRAGHETCIPSYDKSAFDGKGDRKPQNQWATVNTNRQRLAKLVILEGWCVGFRALNDTDLTSCWRNAAEQAGQNSDYPGRLGHSRLEHVRFINEALRGYSLLTDQLDAMIHLDAEDPQYVYEWRLEQENHLRRERGSGMTEAQVVDFVNGCWCACAGIYYYLLT